jgi:hypothetical protein
VRLQRPPGRGHRRGVHLRRGARARLARAVRRLERIALDPGLAGVLAAVLAAGLAAVLAADGVDRLVEATPPRKDGCARRGPAAGAHRRHGAVSR